MYVFLAASGSACALITTNGVGRIHDAETGRTIAQCELPVSATFGGTMASTVESDLIAVAGGDPKTPSGNRIQVVDRSGKTRFQVTAGVGGISAMAFSPDGSTLAAVGYDADVRVWDARTGNVQHVIEELKVAMFDTAFSPDGKVLVTAGADRTIYLWDTQTWKLGRKITGQPETITVIRFSPDGSMLVTGGLDERNFNAPVKVILWDFATGRKIQTWTAEHSVRALSLSPDGQQLAFADGTKQVKLFAVPNKRSTAKY
jgi:WD40 repeat protein